MTPPPTPTASPSASATSPPQFPAGPNPGPFGDKVTQADIKPCVDTLGAAPKKLRDAVAGLSKAQLDTKYKNWGPRQIVHHLADAHMNVVIRWKLALTENVPTIKPWSETAWSELAVYKTTDIAPSLTIMDGVHASWVDLIRSLTLADMHKEFFHPEQKKNVRLVDTLRYYSHHCDHHIGQIQWLRNHHKW